MEAGQVLSIARTSITKRIVEGIDWEPDIDQEWMEPLTGVFTTVTDPERGLRGCIGIPSPEYPLGKAIAIASRRAATEDPRFPPVSEDELNSIQLSVEILSPIKKIEYETLEDLFTKIEIGKDGLVVRYREQAALLLPRVAKEYNWDHIQYLEHICRKAFISQELIASTELEFSKFTTLIFRE